MLFHNHGMAAKPLVPNVPNLASFVLQFEIVLGV